MPTAASLTWQKLQDSLGLENLFGKEKVWLEEVDGVEKEEVELKEEAELQNVKISFRQSSYWNQLSTPLNVPNSICSWDPWLFATLVGGSSCENRRELKGSSQSLKMFPVGKSVVSIC